MYIKKCPIQHIGDLSFVIIYCLHKAVNNNRYILLTGLFGNIANVYIFILFYKKEEIFIIPPIFHNDLTISPGIFILDIIIT